MEPEQPQRIDDNRDGTQTLPWIVSGETNEPWKSLWNKSIEKIEAVSHRLPAVDAASDSTRNTRLLNAVRVARVAIDAALVMNSRLPAGWGGHVNLRSLASWADELATAVQEIEAIVTMADPGLPLRDDISSRLDSTTESIAKRELPGLMETYAEIERNVGSIPGAYVARAAGPISALVSDRLAAYSALQDAERARDGALNAEDAARSAAGITASASLGQHFGAIAEHERGTADLLRWVTGILLGLLPVLALLFVTGKLGDTSTLADIWEHLAVAIPVAVLAAYLGRESARHRARANWAHDLEAQLLTLEAFVAPMAPDQQQDQRRELGRRVFAESGIAGPPHATEPAPGVTGEASAFFDSLTNLFNSLRGGGGRP